MCRFLYRLISDDQIIILIKNEQPPNCLYHLGFIKIGPTTYIVTQISCVGSSTCLVCKKNNVMCVRAYIFLSHMADKMIGHILT